MKSNVKEKDPINVSFSAFIKYPSPSTCKSKHMSIEKVKTIYMFYKLVFDRGCGMFWMFQQSSS